MEIHIRKSKRENVTLPTKRKIPKYLIHVFRPLSISGSVSPAIESDGEEGSRWAEWNSFLKYF